MESLDSILKGKESPVVVEPKPDVPAVEAAPETPVVTETAEQKADRERDEKGRFAKKAEGATPAKPETPKVETAPKVEKPAAPTAAVNAKPGEDIDAEPLDPKAKAYYAKAKDEQRKRQAVERELASLRAQQPQPPIPNPQEHPAEFAQHVEGRVSQAQWDTVLNTSEIAALDKYGEEKVDQAKAWFLEQRETNPGIDFALRQQRHPYKWVIEQYQHAQLLNEIGTDPNAWREQQRAAIRAELEAEHAQKPQVPVRPAAPVPPPSLANATSGSTGTSRAVAYAGPTPLKSIFRR